MPDMSIRRFSEDEYAMLKAAAAAADKSLEAWARDVLLRAAAEPLIKERYAIRFYADEGAAKGIIRRLGDDPRATGGGCSDMDAEQFDAYHKAQDLVRRNGPGDREEAIWTLKNHFNNVFEVPV